MSKITLFYDYYLSFTASLAVLPPPSAVADAVIKRVPRATAWRRNKKAKEDFKKSMAKPPHGEEIQRGIPPGFVDSPKDSSLDIYSYDFLA